MKVPATQWYAAALQALFEYLAGLGSNGSLIVCLRLEKANSLRAFM